MEVLLYIVLSLKAFTAVKLEGCLSLEKRPLQAYISPQRKLTLVTHICFMALKPAKQRSSY